MTQERKNSIDRMYELTLRLDVIVAQLKERAFKMYGVVC